MHKNIGLSENQQRQSDWKSTNITSLDVECSFSTHTYTFSLVSCKLLPEQPNNTTKTDRFYFITLVSEMKTVARSKSLQLFKIVESPSMINISLISYCNNLIIWVFTYKISFTQVTIINIIRVNWYCTQVPKLFKAKLLRSREFCSRSFVLPYSNPF